MFAGDMYPMESEIAKPDATRESVIKESDVGGREALMEAAKGRRIIVSEASDWPWSWSGWKPANQTKKLCLTAWQPMLSGW